MNAEPEDICAQAAQTGTSSSANPKTSPSWPMRRRAPGAVPQRSQRDVALDELRAAQELHVVVRHQRALGVADQVDLGGAGRRAAPGRRTRRAARRCPASWSKPPSWSSGQRRAGRDAVREGVDAVAVVLQQRGVGAASWCSGCPPVPCTRTTGRGCARGRLAGPDVRARAGSRRPSRPRDRAEQEVVAHRQRLGGLAGRHGRAWCRQRRRAGRRARMRGRRT